MRSIRWSIPARPCTSSTRRRPAFPARAERSSGAGALFLIGAPCPFAIAADLARAPATRAVRTLIEEEPAAFLGLTEAEPMRVLGSEDGSPGPQDGPERLFELLA